MKEKTSQKIELNVKYKNHQGITKAEIIVCLITTIIIIYGLYSVIFKQRMKNEKNKAALLKIHNTLNVGDSQDKIKEEFEKFQTGELSLSSDPGTFWQIEMPLEFGASDWNLKIYVENRKIKSIIMRSSDSSIYLPDNAPNDKKE